MRSSELATSGQSQTRQQGVWNKGEKVGETLGQGGRGLAECSSTHLLVSGPLFSMELPPWLPLLWIVIPSVLNHFRGLCDHLVLLCKFGRDLDFQREVSFWEQLAKNLRYYSCFAKYSKLFFWDSGGLLFLSLLCWSCTIHHQLFF